ncbi:MAG: DUF6058 family natural product biosynthesis protein [Gammaproteobacteria bacterium]|nr:DUF6058 family natural product biosynthesis protein [Gammaproteobacteria bacterium]
MKLSKQQRMQVFLENNYNSLAELAEHSGVTEAEILSLERLQCIPGFTYEMRQIHIFTCAGIDAALTENTALATTRYYHPSISSWIKSALVASKNMSLTEVALAVKNNFATQLSKALGEIRTPGCQTFEQAWGYWIDGTWGKCLKEISIDCLARKELARYRIAEIMKQDPTAVNEEIKIELTTAVKNYMSASLDFDAYGMRHLLAVEAIEKFQLDIAIDKKYLQD